MLPSSLKAFVNRLFGGYPRSPYPLARTLSLLAIVSCMKILLLTLCLAATIQAKAQSVVVST